MISRLTMALLLGAFFSGSLAYGQHIAESETSWRIPELERFHEPIYTLWHEAWPAKDLAKLKGLVPAIEKAYAELAGVSLPGILREKKAGWDEQLKALKESVEEYRSAAAADALQPTLDAAEKVHMNYEAMIRVVRPALKELDAFHQVLYVIHHYEMPEGDIAKLRVSIDSLVARMILLNAASLPRRLEKREQQFAKARKTLDETVKAFELAVKAGKPIEEIRTLESALHARYQVLEKVFN